MLNTKKIKKKIFYISSILFVIWYRTNINIKKENLVQILNKNTKSYYLWLKFFFMNLPMLLALIINNYIAKKTKNVEK